MGNKEMKNIQMLHLPIHYNVVFVREGGENDGEEIGAKLTSISLKQHVFPSSVGLLHQQSCWTNHLS